MYFNFPSRADYPNSYIYTHIYTYIYIYIYFLFKRSNRRFPQRNQRAHKNKLNSWDWFRDFFKPESGKIHGFRLPSGNLT